MKTMVTKDTFCQNKVLNSDHLSLTIALFLVSSFFNGLVLFMDDVNPICLYIFLFSYSQFAGVKDCVK